MKRLLALALLTFATTLMADEITFTFVNLSNATFSADAAGLQFANAVNIVATNADNGKQVTLTALDSGHTGAATMFAAGPPLEADYAGAGAGSALVATGSTVFLSGTMLDDGRLEANYPDKAGAFLSRFHVDAVDPAILLELGTTAQWAPEGSLSLTLAETAFDGTTLHATLGGGEFTITTVPVTVVPEAATLLLYGLGLLLCLRPLRRITRQHF